MTEYIEREAALEESVELYYWCGYEDRYGYFVPVDAIQRIPAADVATVRHGRWLDVQEKRLFGDHYFLCSNCKSRNGTMIPFNYCPNCGSKMDGGAD